VNKIISTVLISGIVIAMSACSPAPDEGLTKKSKSIVEQQQANPESVRLSQFFAENFEQSLKRSPLTQSYLGYKWDYDKWDDISEAFNDQSRALAEQQLQSLATFDISQLSAQESVSLQLNKAALERQLANDEFRHHRYIMHQFRAYHTLVPSFLINIHKVEDIKDAKAYISRLVGVNSLFSEVVKQLQIRQELGVFPPKWSYDQMIEASENVISGRPFSDGPAGSTIWLDFQQKVEKLSLPETEQNQLLDNGQQALLSSVLPAYQKLIAELKIQRELTPPGDGVWRLPDGEKWYKNRLNWFTTTDLSAEQVHQIGLDNVQRIHKLMEDIMHKVGFEGDLPTFFSFMRNDEQFFYPNSDEGREAYLSEAKLLIDKMESRIPDYFNLRPQARMIVKRVEAFREQSAGKAFYQSPSKDGSRPGTYYANLYDMNSMPKYQMEALAYHEGIPGHHMQRAIAQELDGIPEFQKYSSFTAYTEGWGLYTEELAKEMGFYQDPYSDFGRLAMELWRACRLVVDTGIHAQQWSREKAIDYLLLNTPNPKNDSVKAIERYIAMPGQATAYLIGKLKIMELRALAEAELGEEYDIKAFHDEVLKDGPVPLDILEQKIRRWIETAKES